MPSLQLDDDERDYLEQFLKHRRLNKRAIDRLATAKAEAPKGVELKAGKTLSYSGIVRELITAVENGLVKLDELIDMLDQSELAGRQHIALFRFPEKNVKAFMELLRSPTGRVHDKPTMRDFVRIPRFSTLRVLSDDDDQFVAKIVTRRSYWITNELEKSADRELFERRRHTERAAVILKCLPSLGIVQIRVPPREKSQQDTAKTVHEFLRLAINGHYPIDDKGSWFSQLRHFDIGAAFGKMVKNKTDFELWRDTPENKSVKHQLARQGAPKPGNDLRKEKTYQFEDGYSRKGIRGFWTLPAEDGQAAERLFIHMNLDELRTSATEKHPVARLVVSNLCDDEDLDHVVGRIAAHL